MSEEKQELRPFSFIYFGQMDDSKFTNYLQEYCLKFDSREKQALQKQKKMSFFSEEQYEIPNLNPIASSIFSNPSINFLDFKEPKSFVGSVKMQEQPLLNQFEQYDKQIQMNEEHLPVTKRDKLSSMIDENQGVREISDQILENDIERTYKRKKYCQERAGSITTEVEIIRKQLESIMEYFEREIFIIESDQQSKPTAIQQ